MRTSGKCTWPSKQGRLCSRAQGLNLTNVGVGPAVAVLSAAVAPLPEPLVLALELVVEGDAPDASSLAAETLFGPQVSPVDLTVVGKLARLPEARVELLAGVSSVLVIPLETAGFKEIPAAARQEDDALARAA